MLTLFGNTPDPDVYQWPGTTHESIYVISRVDCEARQWAWHTNTRFPVVDRQVWGPVIW